jgi:hypothetical protein
VCFGPVGLDKLIKKKLVVSYLAVQVGDLIGYSIAFLQLV